MAPTTRRLFSVCVLIFVTSVVDTVLALIFQWPVQLSRILEGSLGRTTVKVGDLVANGAVTSLPVGPWIVLAVFTLVARSRRTRGARAVVALCLLGALFVFEGLGEAFAPPTPYVPRAVLIVGGVVYGGLGLSLLLSGVADLIDRARAGRQPSRMR